MRTARLVLSVAAMSLVLFGFSAAAQAMGSYSVRPGQSNPAEPVTRAYFKPLITPGGSITQTVIISNTGASTLRLIERANHGFDAKHPLNEVPPVLEKVVLESAKFFLRNAIMK